MKEAVMLAAADENSLPPARRSRALVVAAAVAVAAVLSLGCGHDTIVESAALDADAARSNASVVTATGTAAAA